VHNYPFVIGLGLRLPLRRGLGGGVLFFLIIGRKYTSSHLITYLPRATGEPRVVELARPSLFCSCTYSVFHRISLTMAICQYVPRGWTTTSHNHPSSILSQFGQSQIVANHRAFPYVRIGQPISSAY
jgi:hypothetical protein